MLQKHDNEYLGVMEYILDKGVWKQNRTGVKTKSVFGVQMRFDLSDGTIPLLTSKKMFTKGIIHELLWNLMGTESIKYLQDNNVKIWDEWADENGNLGPVYGVQWRHWRTQPITHNETPANNDPYFTYVNLGGPVYVYSDKIDQIKVLVDTLKNNPDDRRMIVSAWNVAELVHMKLPPCHMLFQCYVADGKLSMILTQRSCDFFLGVPFNIVQYSLLLRMLAEVTGLQPGEFIWNGGDVHIYENHLLQCNLQLDNTPYPSPTFEFNREVKDIDDFKFDDFKIVGYQSHDTIKADVAV